LEFSNVADQIFCCHGSGLAGTANHRSNIFSKQRATPQRAVTLLVNSKCGPWRRTIFIITRMREWSNFHKNDIFVRRCANTYYFQGTSCRLMRRIGRF
jgi:hypothetical protein